VCVSVCLGGASKIDSNSNFETKSSAKESVFFASISARKTSFLHANNSFSRMHSNRLRRNFAKVFLCYYVLCSRRKAKASSVPELNFLRHCCFRLVLAVSANAAALVYVFSISSEIELIPILSITYIHMSNKNRFFMQ